MIEAIVRPGTRTLMNKKKVHRERAFQSFW